jgi:3-oxoacyl-[acyl-carrier protein] reductase
VVVARTRTALVTGGSRGLGAATARRLAADGLDVVVHYHREQQGAEATRAAVEALGQRAWVVQADLSRRKEAEAVFASIAQGPGHIDVLVNNAGVYPRKAFLEISAVEFEQTLMTNLGSAFHCAQLAVPGMRSAGWGRIINLSSILGQTGSRHGAHYASSKAALLGLTKSLALELAPDHITVNAVAPGAIETDILSLDTPEARAKRLRRIPLGRVGEPHEIADCVAFLASDQAAYITGSVISVNGGLHMA